MRSVKHILFFVVLPICIVVFAGACKIRGFKDRPYPTPRVIAETPTGAQANDITLSYRMIEVDGTGSDIALEFSTDGGATWQPATAKGGSGTTGLRGYIFPGTSHKIVWDSFADGITGTQTCRVKITGTKSGSGIVGTPGETNDFEVQNPDYPAISWVAKPDGLVRQVPLTFTWQLDTPGIPISNYYYGLDEDPPTGTTTNTSVTIPAPSLGPHMFRVFAQSTMGLNSAVITATFTCDNAAANLPPSVVITNGPSGTTTDNTPTFEYIGGDPDGSVAGYFVSIDANPPDIWTTSATWTSPGLSCGSHTFYVMAQDNEGANSSVVSRDFTVTVIVNQPPTVVITGGPTGIWGDTTPTFYYTGTDPDGNIYAYYVSVDINPPEEVAFGTDWTSGELTDGDHIFYVRATDTEGANSSLASMPFTINRNMPYDPIPAVGATGVKVSATLAWKHSQPATTFEVFLDTNNPPLTSVSSGLADKYFTPATMNYLTTYYWRVVASNVNGTFIGEVWNFQTEIEIADISWLKPPSESWSICVDGSRAYVADGLNGLQIIDISTPSSPALLGNCPTIDSARGVHVVSPYAYVADEEAGLQIIDISDPANSSIVGTCDTPGSSRDVVVQGAYAYVADMNSGLQIIDVSDPQNTSIVGFFTLSGYAKGIAVNGSYAYIGYGWNGLVVLDVSDPGNPFLTGSAAVSDDAQGLCVVGSYAYVADENGIGLQIIDISNPYDPQTAGACDTPGWARTVSVTGKYACIADWNWGLTVVNVEDPQNPTFYANVDGLGGPSWGVHAVGNYVYLANGAAGFRVLQIVE